jgi:hypothetical protein
MFQKNSTSNLGHNLPYDDRGWPNEIYFCTVKQRRLKNNLLYLGACIYISNN